MPQVQQKALQNSTGVLFLSQVDEFLQVTSCTVDHVHRIEGNGLEEPPHAHGKEQVPCLADRVHP